MKGQKKRGKSFSLLAIALLLAASTACTNNSSTNNTTNSPPNSTAGENQNAPDDGNQFEDVTLTLLTNWNGGNTAPEDEENNPVAKVIKEKTGVTLKIIEVTQNEIEKVNTIFATQDLPDIYTGPAWAGGGEMEAILKAAKENQLVDLTPYLQKYPNLAATVEEKNVPPHMWARYFDPANFDGKSYMLYSQMAAKPEDLRDWLYGQYVRKDIAAQIDIDPQSVHTPDDLYNYLKAIKDANLTSNGQSVIPMGAFHGGWALDIINKMFYSSSGGFSFDSEGKAQYTFMTQGQMDYILYMQKLLQDGLIDPEAFVQSDALAQEKVAQGRYGVLSAHYYAIYDATRSFVNAHPEAELETLGPLNDINGDPYKAQLISQGSDVVAITKKSKNPDAAARVLDFLMSDEGYLLTHYGVEGMHYDLVDGKPVAKPEWVTKMQEDPVNALVNEGINAGYANVSGAKRMFSQLGGEFGYQVDPRTKLVEEITKTLRPNGVELAEGYDPGVFAQSQQQWEQIKPIADKLADVNKQAFYAKTEEEARSIVDAARKQLEAAGIHEIEKAMNDAVAAGTIKFRAYNTAG
ncbi:extracellular solute-binding protein [Paenibacillus sepulcri]|uniref:Extracellular solute-binding protein n=1 Tax=Paenibacillus sepulcri TaxID=359917 RepID=A0ABS7C142_9BACL|nr:extracellular solute-binding protein [Paenibacillus sepulcri]